MKLLLADDHTLFRDALVQYIERANLGAQVTVTKSFHDALAALKADPAQDLVILDLRMPGMNGLDGFKIMRDQYPDMRVALMSGVAEEADVNTAFEYGAVGYFPKTLSGKALLQAIKLVLMGERFMPMDHKVNRTMPAYYDDGPTQEKRRSTGAKSDSASNEAFKLTPRETEVLSYLADGASNKEIANSLGLQVVTVKLHVSGACKKLNAKNRTQAALIAKEHGLDIKKEKTGL